MVITNIARNQSYSPSHKKKSICGEEMKRIDLREESNKSKVINRRNC